MEHRPAIQGIEPDYIPIIIFMNTYIYLLYVHKNMQMLAFIDYIPKRADRPHFQT